MLGRGDGGDPLKRIDWTAGLVRSGLDYYAGCVDEPVGWPLVGERLRAARAVEALERAGTPAAVFALREMTAGAVGAGRTDDARAALDRLAGRR